MLRELVLKRFLRSSSWSKVRKEYIKEHGSCEVCGTTKLLHVHHVIPVSISPHLELDKNNLITLCSKHHLLFGHLMYWKAYNPNVNIDVKLWKNKIDTRLQP